MRWQCYESNWGLIGTKLINLVTYQAVKYKRKINYRCWLLFLFLAAEIRKQRLIEKYNHLKVYILEHLSVCTPAPTHYATFWLSFLLTLYLPIIFSHLANLKHLLRKGGGGMLQRTIDTCHIVDLVMWNRFCSFKILS